MSTRPDLLSTMSEIPSMVPMTQETDRSVITRNPDGTITVAEKGDIGGFRDISHDTQPEDWHENLADGLSPQERMEIADELIDYFETDERVREEHFRRLADGLELMGLKEIPDDSVAFAGAATVTHPLIAEAVTQFQARALEEIFPPQGPVKPYIVGKATDDRVKQGDRLADYMNYQLTEEDGEYFWSTDQMLFYLPLSGSAFKKVFPDPITGMTTSSFVTAEDFVVPYNARSLRTASRYAHRYEMSENDVARAQASGSFLEDARLIDSPMLPSDKHQFGRGDMEDVADSREPFVHEDDVVYSMIEYHIDYAMPWDDEDDIAPPYIVTVERESREVMSVRRNWRHDDEMMQKRIWFVQYKYLPGLGFYGFGLMHIIGSLARAVSGAIRALLDSAVVANLQGGFRAKELNTAGEMRFRPGEWQPVNATIEDLQKGFFNIPAKEPSVALANLTTALIEEGRRFATVTENMVGDADNRGPVGTTLALIEQGSKVFSGIHKRLHKSAREEFKLIATINFEFMDRDEYPYEVQGEQRSVLKSDFDGRVDVIPVSDPNIWSSTQRIAQAQAGIELAAANPELYGRQAMVRLHRRLHEAIRTPDVDQILPELKQQRCDPITENMDFLVGKPAKAFPDQDHEAHIAIHMNFAAHQAAENAELWKQVDPVVQAHVMEHRAYFYREQVEAQLGIKLPPIDLDDEDREELPQQIEDMIAQAVARRLKPPTDPGQDEAAREVLDEAEAEEQARDLETIGKLERAMAEHRQEMRQDKLTFEAEERRKDDEHRRDEDRKDDEHERQMKRDEETHKAELKRKRAETFGIVKRPTSNARKKKKKKVA